MDTKLAQALERLKNILPLEKRQSEIGGSIKELHQQVLRSFVTKGSILTRAEMARYVSDLEAAVNVLKTNDMVTFDERGEPVGAYPFTMEEREHKVQVNGHQVHAMCALDALAVSPMFGMKTQISSRCRVTGEPVSILQSGEIIENPDVAGDIHFGIIWGAADEDASCAESLCMEMMYLKDGEVARCWLAESPGNREVFTLQESVEFASRFFVPLMS